MQQSHLFNDVSLANNYNFRLNENNKILKQQNFSLVNKLLIQESLEYKYHAYLQIFATYLKVSK